MVNKLQDSDERGQFVSPLCDVPYMRTGAELHVPSDNVIRVSSVA
jgi:hypothetical protein